MAKATGTTKNAGASASSATRTGSGASKAEAAQKVKTAAKTSDTFNGMKDGSTVNIGGLKFSVKHINHIEHTKFGDELNDHYYATASLKVGKETYHIDLNTEMEKPSIAYISISHNGTGGLYSQINEPLMSVGKMTNLKTQVTKLIKDHQALVKKYPHDHWSQIIKNPKSYF